MKFLPFAISAIALLATANAHAGSATLTNDRAAFEASLVGAFTVETFGDTYSFPISTGVSTARPSWWSAMAPLFMLAASSQA